MDKKWVEYEQAKDQAEDEGWDYTTTPEEYGLLEPQMLNLKCEWENIHNKVIFDAVNEALDGCRPYGLKGPPLPWSKQTWNLTNKYSKDEEIPKVTKFIEDKVMQWCKTYAGTLPFSELLKEHKIPFLEEEALNHVWEEWLAIVLANEVSSLDHR